MRSSFLKKSLLAVFLLGGFALTAQEKKDALAIWRSGSYAEAVEVCLAELAEDPENMDSYTVLGWSLNDAGRYTEAREKMKEALAIKRYEYRIIENLAEACYYLGDNLTALKYFEQYADIAPNGDRIDQVYYFMGEIFILLGEYHHADIALSTAVHHAPNIARWWARLGYAREKAKDFDYAIKAYEKALQLNPELEDAQRGLEKSRQG